MIEYNIYCDESCHLENNDSNIMTLGGIYCPKDKLSTVNQQIIEIKSKHAIAKENELKWTKISPAKEALYLDIISYFFLTSYLRFRCVIIDKDRLDHSRFDQKHDDWYYKIYFTMLKLIFNPRHRYNVYVDIKDTNSHIKTQNLHKVTSNAIYDFDRKIIQKIQPIRSHEVQIMQLVDILIGAIAYSNKKFPHNFPKSNAKLRLVEYIKEKSHYSLDRSTLYKEEKFNLFVWKGK